MEQGEANQPGDAIPRFEVIGITGMAEVRPGDNLAELIAAASRTQGIAVETGDVLVVTQKVVSKAEGRLVRLSTVDPSSQASRLARESGRDPRLVELILQESVALVRVDTDRGIFITETNHGFVCANAGIDASNVAGDDEVSLLPKEPDASARLIRHDLRAGDSEVDVAVIISDTFGRAWREGQVNMAIGVAGLDPLKDYRGTLDSFGRVLNVTRIAVADELAAAAELVMAKAAGVPVAIVKGYSYPRGEGGSAPLLRDRSLDLFR